MNWSNPNRSGNSEEKSFIYIMQKKSENVKNIAYHPDLVHKHFDNLLCLENVKNYSSICYCIDKIYG